MCAESNFEGEVSQEEMQVDHQDYIDLAKDIETDTLSPGALMQEAVDLFDLAKQTLPPASGPEATEVSSQRKHSYWGEQLDERRASKTVADGGGSVTIRAAADGFFEREIIEKGYAEEGKELVKVTIDLPIEEQAGVDEIVVSRHGYDIYISDLGVHGVERTEGTYHDKDGKLHLQRATGIALLNRKEDDLNTEEAARLAHDQLAKMRVSVAEQDRLQMRADIPALEADELAEEAA